MKIIYLYGFASGPLTDKVQYFKKKFTSKGVAFQIYDYQPNAEYFSGMRVSDIIKKLHEYILTNFPEEKVTLFGSSFGGLLVTLYSHLHPEKVEPLFLIAPALRFTAEFISQTLETSFETWEKEGETLVEHSRFGGRIPLKYSFLQDLQNNPVPEFSSKDFQVKTRIFHGDNDEVVPSSWSRDFAHSNPNVIAYILDGDHQLLDQKVKMWSLIKSELEFK